MTDEEGPHLDDVMEPADRRGCLRRPDQAAHCTQRNVSLKKRGRSHEEETLSINKIVPKLTALP
jgi:hypothetical protein